MDNRSIGSFNFMTQKVDMNTSKITLRDGCHLTTYSSLIAEPKAHLLFVHGYAEHAGRYVELASLLNEKGISFTAYDHRGHGNSDGLKAYIRRFEDLVLDLEEVAISVNDSVPMFIMGHSLGGLIALNHLFKDQRKYAGFICSSAALEIDPDMSPLLQKLAPIIGFLFPKLPTEPLDRTYLTRSPLNLENYIQDPLIYTKGTRARTGAEMLKAIRKSRLRFGEIELPLLVQHGTADGLTMPGGSKKLHQEANSSDKTIHLYPGLYHELVFEPEREKVLSNIIEWMLLRCNKTE